MADERSAYRNISDPDRLQALLEAVMLVSSGLDLDEVLQKLAATAASLLDARYVALGVSDARDHHRLERFVHVGIEPEVALRIGREPEGRGILGLLIEDPAPIRLDDLTHHPKSVGFPANHPVMRSFVGVPVRVRGQIFGNLYLTEKRGASGFSDADVDVVSALALAAGVAISNARLHTEISSLTLVADRERIARDLHDSVVQRLFATGLSLQATLRLVEEPGISRRIEEAIDDLDDTIRQLRSAVFELVEPPGRDQPFRTRVLDLVAESSRGLGCEPEVRFSGPLDASVGPNLAWHATAMLREALANAARHAAATRVEVDVSTGAGELAVQVRDDGVGIAPGADRAGRGLTNMAARAGELGGSCLVRARELGGTEVLWRVPLTDPG